MDRQDTLQAVWIRPQQLGVKDEAVIQPPANVVAGRAPALDRLVVAASGAEVARPARAAGRLLLKVAALEPIGLPALIHAGEYIAHQAILVIDEAMAGIQSTFRRCAHISAAGPAGILFPLVEMDALKGRNDVRERQEAAPSQAITKNVATPDQLLEQPIEVSDT